MTVKSFLVGLALLLAPSIVGAADVGKTFEDGRIYQPYGVEEGKKYPVVVFLHGCAGFNRDSSVWQAFFLRNHIGVIAPDSLARRRSICDPGSHFAARNESIYDMRIEEAEYALAQAKKLEWVDPDHIFLMGHSEGGIAVANYTKGGFKGYIISGYTCTFGLWVKGPTLILNHESDPWMRQHRACGVKNEVILSGSGHETGDDPRAQEAVLEFLKSLQ